MYVLGPTHPGSGLEVGHVWNVPLLVIEGGTNAGVAGAALPWAAPAADEAPAECHLQANLSEVRRGLALLRRSPPHGPAPATPPAQSSSWMFAPLTPKTGTFQTCPPPGRRFLCQARRL